MKPSERNITRKLDNLTSYITDHCYHLAAKGSNTPEPWKNRGDNNAFDILREQLLAKYLFPAEKEIYQHAKLVVMRADSHIIALNNNNTENIVLGYPKTKNMDACSEPFVYNGKVAKVDTTRRIDFYLGMMYELKDTELYPCFYTRVKDSDFVFFDKTAEEMTNIIKTIKKKLKKEFDMLNI